MNDTRITSTGHQIPGTRSSGQRNCITPNPNPVAYVKVGERIVAINIQPVIIMTQGREYVRCSNQQNYEIINNVIIPRFPSIFSEGRIIRR